METARGTKMYGHNFSGIKGFGPSGLSLMLRTSEGHGPSRQSIRDRFRAYVDPAEGATDYVRLLKERYPEALEAAVRGDAAGFVQEIRRRGYFTDEEKKYARAISSLAKERAQPPTETQGAESRPPVPSVSEASARAALEALWWATRRWEPAL
jgi:flagellum-specific peptidoglycan hydrolase FlgJ